MTTRLTISLLEGLRKFVDEQVAAGSYSTASEYVRSLIQAAQQKQEEDERQQWKREELRREIDLGLRQLRRGEFSVYDDDSLKRLIEEVREVRRNPR
jgi:putative addiction module CopG family antidote